MELRGCDKFASGSGPGLRGACPRMASIPSPPAVATAGRLVARLVMKMKATRQSGLGPWADAAQVAASRPRALLVAPLRVHATAMTMRRVEMGVDAAVLMTVRKRRTTISQAPGTRPRELAARGIAPRRLRRAEFSWRNLAVSAMRDMSTRRGLGWVEFDPWDSCQLLDKPAVVVVISCAATSTSVRAMSGSGICAVGALGAQLGCLGRVGSPKVAVATMCECVPTLILVDLPLASATGGPRGSGALKRPRRRPAAASAVAAAATAARRMLRDISAGVVRSRCATSPWGTRAAARAR